MKFYTSFRVNHEQIQQAKLAGFVMIWLALVVYSAEGVWVARRRASAPA
jgi:chloramphenicol-sensitive protein RarD